MPTATTTETNLIINNHPFSITIVWSCHIKTATTIVQLYFKYRKCTKEAICFVHEYCMPHRTTINTHVRSEENGDDIFNTQVRRKSLWIMFIAETSLGLVEVKKIYS